MAKAVASVLAFLIILNIFVPPQSASVQPPGAVAVPTPAQLINGPHVRTNGTELQMIRGAADLGLAPSAMPIYFTLSYDLRDAGALKQLIQEQSTPGSANYHRFLTLKQFEERFGPSQTLYNETIGYFTSQGLAFVPTGSRMTLGFQGTSSEVERAFQTSIHYYRTANGSVVYANSNPLSLPASIGNFVSSINGLTDIVKVRPQLVHAPLSGIGEMSHLTASSATNGASYESVSSVVNFTNPGYLYTNSSFPYGVTQFINPSTLTVAYNATPLYRLGDMGQGSTVAVVMAGGYNPSDLSSYASLVFNDSSQILNRLTPYPVNGATSNATYPSNVTLTSTDAFEMTLDIEYSSTMAPAAHIDAVYGPSLSTASLVSAYSRITTLDPLPNVITNSWGGPEDTWWNMYGPSWQSALALENYFMELAAMGSTVVAASGDSGGFDNYSGQLSLSFPASSPYVVAVGGVTTSVANASGIAFPSPSPYVVNETVAPYGYSEIASQPVWVPDYPLNGSPVSMAAGEQYWYTPSSAGPDSSSGGMGLSYWFQQPWWQHGLTVPDSGRRMAADISAEANFNETVYFSGAWNFFWGGTSFAAPTIAGEFALLDTYLNSTAGNTTGRGSYYLGTALPLIYNLGSDGHLRLRPYGQATSGSNAWDAKAATKEQGWPGYQNWSAGWTDVKPGWNMPTGWGVPDVYNMVSDANALLNPKNSSDANIVLLDGSPVTTIQGNATYVFTLVNQSLVPQAYATVNTTFATGGAPPDLSVETTDAGGNFTFNATGVTGYLAIFSSNSGGTGFQSIWISPANLISGTLSVKVLGRSSFMGGFDVFNGFVAPQYPAIEPMMPNTFAVEVTYFRSPSSSGTNVYNALVTAGLPSPPGFSSPPAYPNSYYGNTLNGTALRSLSFTNMLGIAYVETWNVPSTENYTVNATYLGLNASASFEVAPHYTMSAGNSFSSTFSREYGGGTGYVGLGAENTIVAPGAEGDAQYTLSVRVTDWQGAPVADAPVDIATPNTATPPFAAQPVAGTETRTNASGVASIVIDMQLTLDSLNSGGRLLIQAFNTSYASTQTTVTIGGSTVSLPGPTNDSCAILELLQPVFGQIQTFMDVNGAEIQSDYIGTVGTSASFYVSTPLPTGFVTYNNLSAINYSLDGAPPTTVPLPAVGQTSFLWHFNLPALGTGSHSILVEFKDSIGFNYSMDFTFHVIGQGVDPPPTVTFTSPKDFSYVSGSTTVTFTTMESAYLLSETLTVGNKTYSVAGAGSQTFNASVFGYGLLLLTLKAVNLNGVSSTASLTLYGTPQPVPTAAIISPGDYDVISGTGNVSVSLSYSGDYLSAETLTITGPGVNATYNTSGSTSVVFSGLGPGVYALNYTVTSRDGNSASSVIHFTVLTRTATPGGQQNYTLYFDIALVLATLASGVLAGVMIERALRKGKF